MVSSGEDDDDFAYMGDSLNKPRQSIAKTISQAGLTKQGSEYIPTVLPNESFKKSQHNASREFILNSADDIPEKPYMGVHKSKDKPITKLTNPSSFAP